MPLIGQKEEILKSRSKTYRYLIHKNYKLIYSVNEHDEFIIITDVFVTGQNPIELKRTK